MRFIEKDIGETPLECLRRHFPNDGIPRTYVGRLDPMASGVLLILEGEECKDAATHRGLDKTYTYTGVLGIKTDSGDALGLVTGVIPVFDAPSLTLPIGELILPYPAYSSKPINGTPLWELTKNGTPTEIPSFTGIIHNHTLLSVHKTSGTEVAQNAIPGVQKVRGDFRQQEIITRWQDFIKTHGDAPFYTFTAQAEVTGGFYIRSLVEHIGKTLGIPAFTASIHRGYITT